MSVRILALALYTSAFLFGCGGKDTPGIGDDSGADATDDADQDGFSTPEDCDDADPAVHPDADEICNGIDDDCDARVDADTIDAPTWYRDGDADGYGEDPTVTCDAPVGSVATGGDCDDAQPSVYPGAPEACNDRDDDCDSEIDEDAVPAWYFDDDGDGYGDPTLFTEACLAPIRYVAEGTDCNDANASINPGASEVCDTRDTDEDCDGLAEDADSVTGTVSWYQDADGDGHGDAGITRLACDAPAGFVDALDDCDDTNVAVFPGGAEQCDGQANDCDTLGDWTEADERGIVSWVDAAGTPSAVTDTFSAGTADAPAVWTAPADGQLNVCAGTYYTNLSLTGVVVTVSGRSGAAETILDGGSVGRVVTVEGGGLTLDGITVRNGHTTGNGGGILCTEADFSATDVVVTENTSLAYGGGVSLDACLDAELVDSEISDNTALVAGGLYASESNGLVLNGLSVDGNTGTRGGAGMYLGYSTFNLSDSILSNNATDAAYSAGGLMAYYSDGLIDGVDFTENVSNYGGGLEALTAFLRITDSTFVGNTGGAIYGYVSSTVNVEESDFTENTSTSHGVVYLDNAVTTSFTNCTFTGNTGVISGGFSFSRASSASFVDVTFVENTPWDAYAASTGYTLGDSVTATCDATSGCY